jgi:cytochrome P450
MRRIHEYVEAGEDGSLVGLFAEAPADDETQPDGQVAHWFFATQETTSTNVFRALALIASHPNQQARVNEELEGADLDKAEGIAGLEYLDACIEEAMRLWPTTPLLSRVSLEETEWNGVKVPAGTDFLISNLFLHRDPDTHDFADRFAPEAWIEGKAADDWSFNHFSHGPQGCPGTGIAFHVGVGMIAAVMAQRDVSLLEPELDPDEVAIDTHGMDPVRVLGLARALGRVPERVLVVACEPERIVHGEHDEDLVGELSATVQAAVDEAVPLVESLVAELAAELRSRRKVVER